MGNQIKKDNKSMRFLWIPIVLVVLLVGLLTFIISMRLFTPEDTWICSNGEWLEHGKPSAPKPTLECKKTETDNSDLNFPIVRPISSTHNAINSIPNENPIGPIQISGFFRFLSPAVDILADFGTKLCQWGRPKVESSNCLSVKLGFQEFFSASSK